MKLDNSKGQMFYGMHFCPGVAQYDPPNEESFKVFVNEETIRQMSPSFAGRPVFVDHVDGVDEDVNELRKEADGWVIRSFYNQADGKTWAEFIIVSDRGLAAIRRGFRLSNAYIPELRETEATWNGVDYQKVVTGGEFEHLAIVQNPRYEESVIMTPDEFKMYNEKLTGELKRLTNKQDKKEKSTVNLFTRKKVENGIDIKNTLVELPKSKKEMTLEKVINDHDAFLNMNGYANGDHMVKVGDKDEMSVNDLVKAYQSKCNDMDEAMNAADDGDEAQEKGGEPKRGKGDSPELDNEEDEVENDNQDHSAETDVGDRGGDESLDNVDDEGEGKKKPGGDNNKNRDQAKKHNSLASKIAAKKKAAALANARRDIQNQDVARVDLSMDQVARGKARYGSN